MEDGSLFPHKIHFYSPVSDGNLLGTNYRIGCLEISLSFPTGRESMAANSGLKCEYFLQFELLVDVSGYVEIF
jgi:hypothetical protein